MSDAELFLNYVGENYDKILLTMKKYSINKTGKFDKDIFADTILRCYDNIVKKQFLKDCTPQGIQNFIFKAFANNILREKQYARNAKRIETSDFNGFLLKKEKFDTSTEDKLKQDLLIDFSTLYILEQIEKRFGYEHCHLWAMKHLNRMTYSEICKKTSSKGSREKILNASKFIKENITKEQIQQAFKKFYEEQFC